ncbi:MAG: sulfatase-like hydrolase/transferase [Candidatus Hydrogenedentota bacterium]|nr:MAG: sulfatase-like hydrolase/transferase [Candidatus Hydrogenedentota bacterium]
MTLRFRPGGSVFAIIASGALVMAEAGLTALFIQSFLTRWGYDNFWSNGLFIAAGSCVLCFMVIWYSLSELGANLSGISVGRTLPRYSSIFLPLTILIGYRFMPKYHRQNIASYFAVTVISLTLVIGIFLFSEAWKKRDKPQPGTLLNRRVVLSFLCSLALVLASFRFHDNYLLKSLSSEITRASHTDVSTGVNVSMPIRLVRIPGRFTWKTRVPQGGVLQVAAFPNENFRERDVKIPIHYGIRIKPPTGEDLIVSREQLNFEKVSIVKYDLQDFAGENITFEFEMKEPFSIESALSYLHVLLRPYLWAPAKTTEARATLLRAYWSEPVIYSPRKSNEPNVLFIIVDTLRVDRMGCYGYELDTTPTVDRLASDGVVFKQAISQSPWTLPSVASIYTGRLPASHLAGMREGNSQTKLVRQTNLVDLVRANGFYTVGFVTNVYLSKYLGMDQSFDEHYYKYEADAKHESDLMCRWLDDNADKRFFCVLHYIDPRVPYEIKKHFVALPKNPSGLIQRGNTKKYEVSYTKSQLRILTAYDSEIAFTDAQIKRVLDRLDQIDLLENTLIIFVSDHGEEFYEHGALGHGQSLYDELVHVPLIFTFPSRLPKGKIIEEQVRLIDILPTVFDILGIDFDPGVCTGRSLVSLISGESSESREAVSEFLLKGAERKSIRSGKHKLIFNPDSGHTELYDISTDPRETVNLAEAEPKLRDTLLSQLKSELERSSLLYAIEPEFPVLDEETRKSLKALGYLD